MRYLIFLFPFSLFSQNIQLATPQLGAKNVFFKGKTKLALEFDLEGATIHYALQDSVTAESPVYKKPIKIRKSCTIRAIAVHPDFETSDVLERQLIKVKYRPQKAVLLKGPSEKYPGNGAASLIDLQKGGVDLKSGAWLGFLGDTVHAKLIFSGKKKPKSLIISTLADYNAWIFPPSAIKVFALDQANVWQEIATRDTSTERDINKGTPSYADFISIDLKPYKSREFRVDIMPWGLLPTEHPGAGNPAWLFLDELIFQ